ncbi:MAG: hypothetical protein GY828_01780 [Candidatus Gracilibacteria bacterium]|nr:hypothetical protein [Candidatus Gracilibacteria bacterium]
MKKITLFSIFLFPFLLLGQTPSVVSERTFTFETVRQLSELKLTTTSSSDGQAYSWISNDGLHIYYTHIGKEDLLYFSSRENIQDQFETPKPLKLDFSD